MLSYLATLSVSQKVFPIPRCHPKQGLQVTCWIVIGTPKHYDVTGKSGKNNRHFFCGECGSSLYTEVEIMADKTIIKAGTLDNGETSLRGHVDVEFYVKDRVGFVPAVEGAKQETTM